jgi:two-component system osmolarity sensor histidine kinase EnvZ
MKPKKVALSLFWRTFFLIALLLVGGVFAWTQTFRALEIEPRATQQGQQIAGLVKLARAALQSSDGINRVALIKGISNQESLRLAPREPGDKWEPYETDRVTRAIGQELRRELGPDTVVAGSVNGSPGLWVGFSIEKDPFWLQADPSRAGPILWNTLTLWVSMALLATVLGSAAIARLINQPLKELSFAASRIREGEFDSRLDENTLTSEIRQVNMGFNRMARELAKVEQDRAVMLAGISHDLRTPLTRLQYAVELVPGVDAELRSGMHRDIADVDAILSQFIAYARDGRDEASEPLDLAVLCRHAISACEHEWQVEMPSYAPMTGKPMALQRAVGNLLVNAQRHGAPPYSLRLSRQDDAWRIEVVDHGPGLSAQAAERARQPFVHGEGGGTGLGLAIVERVARQHDGELRLLPLQPHGLVATLVLRGS